MAAEKNLFDIEGLVSKPGNGINEDLIGHTESCIWILDGATGISDKQILPGSSDASWFVHSINDTLRKCLNEDSPIQDILKKVIELVIGKFKRDVVINDYIEVELPSASFAIARFNELSIELVNIGDCQVLYQRTDGTVNVFGTSRVKEFDQIVIDELLKLKSIGYANYEDILIELKKIVLKNRELKNTEDGYWILDLSHRALPHLQIENLLVKDTRKLLFVSDGLYRLVDTYHTYDDEELLNTAANSGLQYLYDKLRQIEKGDPCCESYPRIKLQDDASGLLVSFN
jgi:hypothetical protein